jgi:uncharacterized membrane protein
MAASDNSNDKLFAGLTYPIPIVGIIVLLSDTMKNNPVLKTHAIQSLALTAVLVVVSIILTTVTLGFGGCLAPLLIIIPIVFGIQAYQGKDVNIPVLTDFCKKQGWI